MKIALVYDRVNKFGGAERILQTLHEIWPDAPLFTAVYDPTGAVWSKIFRVKASFLKYIPFLQAKHEFLTLLTPFAFESFDFRKFDVVISISSAEAKSLITSESTMHVCYCLTPTRYLWSGYFDYLQQPGIGKLNTIARAIMKMTFTSLRKWDFIASQRPDYYIAISKNVQMRIKSYYQRDSVVIYPPMNLINYEKLPFKNKDYYLIVARLVPYKKIDYSIQVFNELGWNLKIIGKGIDESRLKDLSNSNIEFIDSNLTDQELGCYYRDCRGLIFPGEEDFGLTAIEAQFYGKPVLALARGGALETVVKGKTGEFYEEASVKALKSALLRFCPDKYLAADCRENAKKFNKNKFKSEMKKRIEILWNKYQYK